MKRKTAMQELIEKLYLRLNYHLESSSPSPEIIELIIGDAESLLEKEKEQMIVFYKKGYKRNVPYDLTGKAAEIDYNKTYKQD